MRKSLFIGLVAILGLIGCSRNQEIDVPDANLSLFARTESPAESRTVVESGVHVYWEPGDEIAVFMGEKSAKFTTDITAASGTATFKGTFGDQGWPEEPDLWAVYPFSEDAAFDGETITTTLPSEQVAREGSFGKDMNLAIAHSNFSTLQFYNVGGGIRFSVTEEGIKKVMFEGLSGEIISGKVKIGMDENGKPEVREVTGGSQFITLLPPTGQETFKPGAWYYIIAIPGSLEGGYKLRFYKDSDYARKVSEKAVLIKRSIFGNIEKADSGINFEPQTTHFPETKEEWEESIALTEQFGKELGKILNQYNVSITLNEDLLYSIQNIDGVIRVKENSSRTGVGIMLRDSLWVNYMFDRSVSMLFPEDIDINESHSSQQKTRKNESFPTEAYFSHSSEDPYTMSPKRKAIILSPYNHTFKFDLNSYADILVGCGYDRNSIEIYEDHRTILKYFYGEYLSNFDFIFIITHGGTGFYAYNGTDNVTTEDRINEVTALDTWITFSSDLVDSFLANHLIKKEDIAIIGADDNDDDIIEFNLAMTPSFLHDAVFNNACVILHACHSTEISEENDPGSMVWRFINQGAEIVSGNNDTAGVFSGAGAIYNLMELVSRGFSFQDATDSIKASKECEENSNRWFTFYHLDDPQKTPESHRYRFEFQNRFEYYENPKLNNNPYYLVYPFSKLNIPVVGDNMVSFFWNNPLSSFEILWEFPDYNIGYLCSKETYTVVNDIVIDGTSPYGGININGNSFIWNSPIIGKDHSWDISTKIIRDNEVIGEYLSKGVLFDVPGIGDIEGTERDPWN